METSNVRHWLAQPPDFAAGVQLYEQLGGSATYKQLFALGETSYSRQVLVAQLQALVGPVFEPPRAPTPPAPMPQATAVPADPALLAGVRTQLKAARDERSHLHAQLTAPGLRQAARCKMVHRICQLTDQVLQLLADEAHVLEHGRRPGPVATADVTDAGELRRRLDNLVSLRSKLRKRPERAGELPALEAEINLIRNKLNTPS
ncbi:hypothetical protein [Hymenobacter psychrotolerans]|uniref:Uncharacterized protein n=1 Tax=Hymenobacter psychrotolerans DSM 18569 TaxID=1121959 RepID=A0A1M7E724_9BACT|nr:hypothetical protein [Hymenobacter psychrotolerans]SHL87551.1 hypothetical protein SAMN02746009_03538 [Hymenobacter psychrotolerans DSM 18569]